VIGQFLASWPLFAQVYLTAWLIALVLSLVGVLVVARDQIFLGAAMSQSATLGIALALIGSSALPWLRFDSLPAILAVGFSVLAAVLTAWQGDQRHDSHEARTGWVFLASSSGAILIVAHSPHGLAEIQRLLSSSLIGATTTDVWMFGVCALGTIVALTVWHPQVLLLALDPAMGLAAGMRMPRWHTALMLWLGLVVGLSIRASGMLYTFGCLVLPALIAKNLCREVRPLFIVAPCIAVSLAGIGCVLADATDSPPAQMTVALFSLALALVWLIRWWRVHTSR